MPIKFKPNFVITPEVANDLIRIEKVKGDIQYLSLTPKVLASLRESAKLYTTHYSTMIEGNQLLPSEIDQVLQHEGHFPGRERDEREVKGYYEALKEVEQFAAEKTLVNEKTIQLLHALLMSYGITRVRPSAYRDGQNVIRDARTSAIIYMPPEAKDVSGLMEGLVQWIKENLHQIPCPIVAGIAHYQIATIHPYYDGNGRLARLVTTLILHLGGYDLKGLYSLEEYYARNLQAYYDAISVGPSHNYYLGRQEADITHWIEYMIKGMAVAFENVLRNMDVSKNDPDEQQFLYKLDPKQRKVLELFLEFNEITSKQVGELFDLRPRSASALCKKWVECDFLKITDPSNKNRKYQLCNEFKLKN
ncbi:MAG: hypothetical protein K940chlam8_00832 [Chlamydiae bacterium]|nr:hypothetical protein [Chlamydiota bacterium]